MFVSTVFTWLAVMQPNATCKAGVTASQSSDFSDFY